MSTIASQYQPEVHVSYVANVGRAVRALIAAVFAVQPRRTAAGKPASVKDIDAVRFEAARHDAVMPNLAAELRYMSSRAA